MKMKQPDLGKKIAELRKARGYTQEELVEICNLSVRTLQRIESGEVSPRSYTLKVIFSALEYEVFEPAGSSYSGDRLRRFLYSVLDLFNLKTNTMKKISVLSAVVALTCVVLLAVSLDGNAQSSSKVKQMIEGYSDDFVRWFNTGQVDSLTALYSDHACLIPHGCGHAFIRQYYEESSKHFRFEELNVVTVSVSKSIAVEKGRWTIRTDAGATMKGEYLTEWHKMGKKWLIVNDISNSY